MHLIRLACLLIALTAALAPGRASAQAVEPVTRSQRRAVEEFLGAVSTGNPATVAYALHPAELERLRSELLELMRSEDGRGDFTIRSRLFGAAATLPELERLTALDFYALLGQRLVLVGRRYADARYLAAIRDSGDVVHVVLRGKPPEERGKVQVVNLVSIVPYGKDWKAAIPSEIEAQIDDLVHGRALPVGLLVPGAPAAPPRGAAMAAPAAAAAPQKGRGTGSAPAGAGNPPAILELLNAAEKDLIAADCEAYYKQRMSPNFRRVTSKKALETLIAACERSDDMRERLVAMLRIVSGLTPRFEYEGNRAVYDVTNQGLPYDRVTLERIEKRWYIAE